MCVIIYGLSYFYLKNIKQSCLVTKVVEIFWLCFLNYTRMIFFKRFILVQIFHDLILNGSYFLLFHILYDLIGNILDLLWLFLEIIMGLLFKLTPTTCKHMGEYYWSASKRISNPGGSELKFKCSNRKRDLNWRLFK